jgi:predicted SAM-dependent methyltransferase
MIEIKSKMLMWGYHHFNSMLNAVGYSSIVRELPPSERVSNDIVLLNVGAGNWGCDGWINLDYPSEHYERMQSRHKFIPYDIRSDAIPFGNDSVDAIYCSHVIEHIEDEFIEGFFKECRRVLKKEGVLRFACPDAEFLYHVSKLNKTKTYWRWRHGLFRSVEINPDELRAVDYLVREIASANVLRHGHLQKYNDYEQEFNMMSMTDFFDFITSGLDFDVEHVGAHINWWTYQKAHSF